MTRLLDTNHAIAYLNDDPRIQAPFAAARSGGDLFATTTPVLGELHYGAQASQRSHDNLKKLEAFASQLIVYPFDVAAAAEFGKIKAECRSKGKPIPTADAQIAAVARLYHLAVLTDDVHFDDVDGLTIENWLR